MARTTMLPFAAFLCLVLLVLPNTEAACQQRSKTWSGFCADSSHCDNQCRDWERADHGECHQDGLGSACFCNYPASCPCGKSSKTWSGFCGDSSHCNNQCRDWEHASFGACHHDGIGSACYCYFPSC